MADIHCDNTNGNDSTGDGSAGNPYQTLQKCVDVAAGGDTIWVGDSSAQTLSAAITWNTGWSGGTTADNPLTIRGWDYSSGAAASAMAEIDLQSTATTCFSTTSLPNYVSLDRLNMHSSTGDLVGVGDYWVLTRCQLTSPGSEAVARGFAAGVKLIGCRIIGGTSANAIQMLGGLVIGCYVAAGSGRFAISCGGLSCTISDSVILAGSGGVEINHDWAIIKNCTIVGSGAASQKGIAATANAERATILNCVLTGFSGVGAIAIEGQAGVNFDVVGSNQFFDNTTDESLASAATIDLAGDSTSDPNFVDAAGGDYTPQTFVAGFPGTLLGSSTDAQRVIGAVQRAAGGGGSVPPNFGLRTGGRL